MTRRTGILPLLGFVVPLLGLSACGGDTLYDPVIEGPDTVSTPGQPGDTTATLSLAEVINAYRREKGLASIPLSKSLTRVAEAHVKDLQENNPATGVCNGHSWSSKGNWTACCYTADHAQAKCMWDKPKEITGGVYTGNGYEIASGASWVQGMTPQRALQSWKGSSGHHDVILNQGVWSRLTWRAMGAAYSDSWAVVWFGEQPDPQGPPGGSNP